MRASVKALVGILSMAAVGVWIAARRQKDLPIAGHGGGFVPEMDDDAAAEIIRRARPSLERAYQLLRV